MFAAIRATPGPWRRHRAVFFGLASRACGQPYGHARRAIRRSGSDVGSGRASRLGRAPPHARDAHDELREHLPLVARVEEPLPEGRRRSLDLVDRPRRRVPVPPSRLARPVCRLHAPSRRPPRAGGRNSPCAFLPAAPARGRARSLRREGPLARHGGFRSRPRRVDDRRGRPASLAGGIGGTRHRSSRRSRRTPSSPAR